MIIKTRNKWIKRTIITVVSLVLIAGGLLAGFGIYERNKLEAIATELFHQNEKSFKNNPNIIDALKLTRKTWVRKEYDKTISYGEYCQKAGLDSTKLGSMVHVLMANAYLKSGNKENACTHVNLAVNLAQRDHIPHENLKEYGLKEVLDSCK